MSRSGAEESLIASEEKTDFRIQNAEPKWFGGPSRLTRVGDEALTNVRFIADDVGNDLDSQGPISEGGRSDGGDASATTGEVRDGRECWTHRHPKAVGGDQTRCDFEESVLVGQACLSEDGGRRTGAPACRSGNCESMQTLAERRG